MILGIITALSLLGTIYYFIHRLIQEVKDAHRKINEMAVTDELTGLANRRSFFERFEREFTRARRYGHPLACMMIDLDHFKMVNDTYGHQAGDLCLQKVAEVISQNVRSQDLAARYGGEEFAIVLPNVTPEIAMMVATRIVERLVNLQIPHSSSQASEYVSLSCGVASTSNHLVASPQDLIANADRALYQAKEQGRNRAVLDLEKQ